MDILKEAEKIANEKYDGHYTLMKFSTNWRFCFGTLFISSYAEEQEAIKLMAEGKTMEEAIRKGINEDINCYKICDATKIIMKRLEEEYEKF